MKRQLALQEEFLARKEAAACKVTHSRVQRPGASLLVEDDAGARQGDFFSFLYQGSTAPIRFYRSDTVFRLRR